MVYPLILFRLCPLKLIVTKNHYHPRPPIRPSNLFIESNSIIIAPPALSQDKNNGKTFGTHSRNGRGQGAFLSL